MRELGAWGSVTAPIVMMKVGPPVEPSHASSLATLYADGGIVDENVGGGHVLIGKVDPSVEEDAVEDEHQHVSSTPYWTKRLT